MTIPEVAIYLKMSKSKVYSLIQRRKMPHVRIGRNVRVRVGDLARWLEKQKDPYAR
jgi:excisionase family DNA binding protein